MPASSAPSPGVVAPRTATVSTSPATKDDGKGIQSMLDGRAKALLARNRQAFLAGVDEADPVFHAAQKALFDNLAGVSLASYSLTLRTDRLGDLVRKADRERFGAETHVYRVMEDLSIAGGYDPIPAREEISFTFVRRNDSWKIAGDRQTDDLAIYSARHLWDFGPVISRASAHFLVLFHSGQESGAAQGLELAEQAYTQVAGRWALSMPDRVVLEIPGSTEELRQRIQSTFELSNFVAFTYSSVDTEQGWRESGVRILVNPSNFARYTPASKRLIFAHELGHVASRAVSGPFTPAFVEEAVGQVIGEGETGVGGGEILRAVRTGTFDGKLPEDWQFVVVDSGRVRLSYQEAYEFGRYLEQTAGKGSLVRFYTTLTREAALAAGTWRYHLDRALREVTGLSTTAFESRWAAEVRRQAGT